MSKSEPLITYREYVNDVKTGQDSLAQDKARGYLITDLVDIRYEGGMILSQAFVRNVRTCRLDVKGEAQVGHTTRARVPMLGTGAEQLVVVMKLGNSSGAKGLCHSSQIGSANQFLGGVL